MTLITDDSALNLRLRCALPPEYDTPVPHDCNEISSVSARGERVPFFNETGKQDQIRSILLLCCLQAVYHTGGGEKEDGKHGKTTFSPSLFIFSMLYRLI